MTISKKLFSKTFWITIILLSAYYLYRAILFRFYKEGLGPSLWDKQFLFVSHITAAIIPLVLGPLQFWNWFRNRYIHLHRSLGKLYIIGSILGGISAFILAITIQYEGSIVPLILLSLLWLYMTIAAWVTIRNKNIKAHRLFMIRSYTLGLTFIFLRILGDLAHKQNMYFFIKDEETKNITNEWLSWVLPLLIVEFIITWTPSFKQKKSNR